MIAMDTHLLLKLIFVLCTTIPGLYAQTVCPPNFVSFENSCYFFGRRERTFADAWEACSNLGGYLAHVTSEEEHNFLANRLRMDNRVQDHWIGITDSNTFNATEGEFQLASEPFFTLDFINYDNWRPGEPNNGNGDQDCVHMWADGELQWDDDNCDDEKLFICERGLLAGPPA